MKIENTTITGSLGHLGYNYLRHMAGTSRRMRIFALDIKDPSQEQIDEIEQRCRENPYRPRVEFRQVDLTRYDSSWANCIEKSDSVVHFAAVNPFPDANPIEAAKSMDITLHAITAVLRSESMKRFVFASSNHVMGRYKDAPLSDTIAGGNLTTEREPAPGTLCFGKGPNQNSTSYAWSKLMGERLCRTSAETGGEQLSFVSVRIGACKPGENYPEVLAKRLEDPKLSKEILKDLQWRRDFWLSQADFHSLFDRAQEADCETWPSRAIIVNGMSANPGMKWSIEEGKAFLGFLPSDSVLSRMKNGS